MANLGRQDQCPFCHGPLEIICLKFRFRGVASISTCPNCACVATTEPQRPRWRERSDRGRPMRLIRAGRTKRLIPISAYER